MSELPMWCVAFSEEGQTYGFFLRATDNLAAMLGFIDKGFKPDCTPMLCPVAEEIEVSPAHFGKAIPSQELIDHGYWGK